MALSKTRQKFIKEFYSKCKAICPEYGLVAINAIVAQACCESRYGESELSTKYHNYWGMKCGSSYKGKSVNMTTKEEYKAGTLTTIKDNFRAYDTVEDGIKGYCEFITGMKRYKNLLGVTDDSLYIKNIKADGWATSNTYVTTVTNILSTVNGIVGATDNTTTTSTTPSVDKIYIKKAQDGLNKYINAGLALDGLLGANTRKATAKALQYSLNRDYGSKLSVDGVVGNKTLGAIKGHAVKRGAKSYLVTWLEISLMLLGYYTSTIEIAGSFGSGVDKAVRNFQNENGLTVDGSAGEKTINKILSKLGLI